MAEVNEQVLRALIMEVLKEMGSASKPVTLPVPPKRRLRLVLKKRT